MKRVDIVIAAHNPQRRIDRAVSSIVNGNPEARAVVVCHNTSISSITATLDPVLVEGTTFLELNDSIPSPSGPFMFGMRQSKAEYVSIMGSDDQLEPGAVAAWLELADRYSADSVITRLTRGESRTLVRSPAARPWARGILDVYRDRLPYRSAPLGLIRRTALEALQLELTPGARNGGDLEFVSRLWSGGRVVYQKSGPGYVEMADADDRVTHVAKPVTEELAPLTGLLSSAWFSEQTKRTRRALAVKAYRRTVVDTIIKRPRVEDWSAEDLSTLAQIAAALHRIGISPFLSLAESRLLAAVMNSRVEDFSAGVAAAKKYRSPAAIGGTHPLSWASPIGSFRYTVASALMR